MIVGKVIGDRYRIQERIGAGGMAVVYRAVDTLLDRPVAVKVLRDGLTGDAEFVRRFRREAQSAASLSHRHVVNIFDVGREGDTDYIVMELVDGPDLKSKIVEGGPLPPDQAAALAREIIDGLGHAHERGIIHRDIKPSNILITADGHVKVSDFGIARHSSATDTLTSTHSVFGSAHYFSPEQARGLSAGERSDLYSLGVVLYEMATGSVPFKGESPISVALKHVQEDPVAPSRLNPEVPRELEEIILRALSKEPEDRFSTASEMREALTRFIEDYHAGRTHAATGELPTQRIMLPRDRRRVNGMGSKAKAKGRPRGWTALVVVILILAAGAIFGGRYALGLLYVPETEVPNLVGLSVYDAETLLRQRGLTLEVVGEGEFSPSIPVNHVLWQDHNPDLPVREGRVIKVRVSLGAQQVNVPPLTGLRRIDAEDSLRKAGLKLGEVTERYSSDQGEGWVLQQVPEAREVVEAGTLVDLVISKGPLLVPLLFGKTLEEAEEVLDELELALGEVTEIYSDDPDGTVVLQSPHPPSEVRPGQRINLVLSKGSAPPPRETLLMIHVPAGRGMVTVQLVLIDGSESQVLHEARHDSGTSFPLSVKYRSDGARVQMFINGQLHDEIALS